MEDGAGSRLDRPYVASPIMARATPPKGGFSEQQQRPSLSPLGPMRPTARVVGDPGAGAALAANSDIINNYNSDSGSVSAPQPPSTPPSGLTSLSEPDSPAAAAAASTTAIGCLNSAESGSGTSPRRQRISSFTSRPGDLPADPVPISSLQTPLLGNVWDGMARHVISQAFLAEGVPDLPALEIALQKVLRLHPLIFACLQPECDPPLLSCGPSVGDGPFLDHEVALPEDLEAAAAHAACAPIKLVTPATANLSSSSSTSASSRGCFRATVLESTGEFVLVLSFPAAIFDAISVAVFARQLWEQYDCGSVGAIDTATTSSFADLLAVEHGRAAKDPSLTANGLDFWASCVHTTASLPISSAAAAAASAANFSNSGVGAPLPRPYLPGCDGAGMYTSDACFRLSNTNMSLFKDLLIFPNGMAVEDSDICCALSLTLAGLVVCHLSNQDEVYLSSPVSARDECGALMGPLNNEGVLYINCVEHHTLMDLFLATAGNMAQAREYYAVPCPVTTRSSIEVVYLKRPVAAQLTVPRSGYSPDVAFGVVRNPEGYLAIRDLQLQPFLGGVTEHNSDGLPFAMRVLLWETPDPGSDRVCGVVQARHNGEEMRSTSDPNGGSKGGEGDVMSGGGVGGGGGSGQRAAKLFGDLMRLICKEAANEPQITLEKMFTKLRRGQTKLERAAAARQMY